MTGEPSYRPSGGARLKNAFAFVVLVAVLYIVLRTFVLEVLIASDPMMAPTVETDGWTLVVRYFPDPRPGDVVAFDRKGKSYVRRVISTGKSKVRLDRGVPVIDGVAVPSEAVEGKASFGLRRKEGVDKRKARIRQESLGGRTYRVWTRWRKGKKKGRTKKVPEGHFFVACDNRAYCKDSRHFGAIPADDVWGMRLVDVVRRAVPEGE